MYKTIYISMDVYTGPGLVNFWHSPSIFRQLAKNKDGFEDNFLFIQVDKLNHFRKKTYLDMSFCSDNFVK